MEADEAPTETLLGFRWALGGHLSGAGFLLRTLKDGVVHFQVQKLLFKGIVLAVFILMQVERGSLNHHRVKGTFKVTALCVVR